jgi:DNA topoisomerase III
MQLIIAEKPSVASDLARVLPGTFKQHEGYRESADYLITWAVGHMLELKTPEDYDSKLTAWLLDSLPIIPGEASGKDGKILPPFQRKARSGMTKQLRLIRKLAQRDEVTELVNACDAAREGELIFREIEAYIGVDKPVKRLWLQSMTGKAILSAFGAMQPQENFAGLSAAAYCRAEADWLIGMNATRAITKRLKGRREKGVWSAGRVQTPTLALLVHRELKVLAHVPKSFWRLKGQFSANGHDYAAQYRVTRTGKDADKIWDEKEAELLLAACQNRPIEISEKVSESSRRPPFLHSLTSLQKEGNSRYGMSARRTLAAAQRLYEGHKVLTYPRTDSNALPQDYRSHVDGVISALAASGQKGGVLEGAFSEAPRAEALAQAATQVLKEGLQNTGRNFDDNKVGDHFAIIPTGNWPNSPLGGDDAKVFELVLRRFLAAFMGPSRWQKVVRETRFQLEAGANLPSWATAGPPTFFTESNRMVMPGWQLVDKRPPASELLGDLGVEIGVVVAGKTRALDLEPDQTRPPKRYTEASLLKAMETATDLDLDGHEDIDDDQDLASLKQTGLGTPATRADTIESLLAKGYLLRSGKTLRAGAKGVTLIDFLERLKINNLAKAELTADMELHLYQVEEGKRDAAAYMKEVKEGVRDLTSKVCSFQYEELFVGLDPVGVCPRDGYKIFEGLKGYRCCKEPVGADFEIEFKGMGKEAKTPLAEVCDLVAAGAKAMAGVVEVEALPKRVKGKVKLRRSETGPTLKFQAQLAEMVGRVLPQGSITDLKVSAPEADECGFTIWKEFRGRYMNRPVVSTLLIEKDTGPLDGFVSMRGETYAGRVRLDDEFKLEFEPVKGYKGSDDSGAVAPELVSYEVDASAYVLCPKCEEGQIIETPTHFECRVKDSDKGCGLKMPRTVCKRELTRADLLSYFDLTVAHTVWIEDFISRKGRAFTARLNRKPNGRHGFEFKPREGGPARKKTTKKKVSRKKAVTKKKVAKKKATKKKASKKTVAIKASGSDS